MAREFSWSDVRGGIVAFAVIVAIAAVVLKFGRVGAIHGDTMRVYTLVGQATGVATGSDVWLSGQKVGKITAIRFLPVATDTARRILVEMQIRSEYRDAIHRDATAQIRAGGSFIGAVVVYLTPGTTRTLAIASGDTIAAKPEGTMSATAAQMGSAARELPAIMANVSNVLAALRSGRGTAGAVVNGPGLAPLGEVKFKTLRMVNRMQGGGTVGLIMQGGLTSRAGRVMASVDSVRSLLASKRTSLGRFRRDSTLMVEVAAIQGELAEVQRSLDEPRGTAGRVLRDSALTNSVATAKQEMTLLFADLKAHPFRYISF